MHKPRNPPTFLRRFNLRLLFAAVLLSCVGYYAGRLSTLPSDLPSSNVLVHKAEIQELEARPVHLNGLPTQAFRGTSRTLSLSPQSDWNVDNLRDDVQYITSWPGTGYTNDLIGYMHLIYLALLTERVPIVPFFTPTHVSYKSPNPVPPIDFGVMFDVPRLSKALGIPILEWWQVKVRAYPNLVALRLYDTQDKNSTTLDSLGCWSIWKGVRPTHKDPHPSTAPGILHLVLTFLSDISWTTPPSWIKLVKEDPNEPHAKFTSLMALSFPDMRKKNLRTPTPSPRLKLSLPPDEQLMCLDHMYWVANVVPHEYMEEFSTGWRLVGKHLHWNPRVEALAREYTRQSLGLLENEAIPPISLTQYIAVHVRHGDFGAWCTRPLNECFAPLSAYALRVDEVKEELKTKKGISVEHVILTSDETDGAFWEEAKGFGWHRVDHDRGRTIEKYGRWYPLILDAAIQSGGVGMVGSKLSTVSLIAAHRVRAWQGGVVRIVKWGKPGADDH
ncbi:hypothetical protein R3P38DRAFT_2666128 [Favolaschia claudopus]|uniref:Uncharacterized protein n=1 Tax=Favolaschia claudopus TaxID=2862362 RepID=A0AAV9ZC55_9AGAR